MQRMRGKGMLLLWILIVLLGSSILYKGTGILAKERISIGGRQMAGIGKWVTAAFVPVFLYSGETEERSRKFLFQTAKEIIPGMVRAMETTEYEVETQSMSAYEEILHMEAADEEMKEAAEDWIEENNKQDLQNVNPVSAEAVQAAAKEPVSNAGQDYPVKDMSYDFLLNHFYTVDSTTEIKPEQLDVGKLLSKNMHIKEGESGPQILIYHTHSQEGFTDSVPGDENTTIVGVGAFLAEILTKQYGMNVIHNKTQYDVVNGKLDRNKAYSVALKDIKKILSEHPSIEVVIDMHRDGVEGVRLVTDIAGKPTARIMFFNGLSYTKKNGKISYLENPYIQDNLAFSLKLQVEAAGKYPGLTRKIYLKGYRYNMHLLQKSLLVEVGAQNNTLQEEKNAMEPFADLLAKVLKK